MRDYGKVHAAFWSSVDIRKLSEDGRMLALYLLTCPHGTIAGVFRVPDGYVSEDLQWGSERVKQGFKELFEKGFANRCETTNWVWVIKHLEWNKPENPNQRKAAQKIAQQIPSGCDWRSLYMRACGDLIGLDWLPIVNPPRRVPEGLLNQYQYQYQEQKQKQTHSAASESEEQPPTEPPGKTEEELPPGHGEVDPPIGKTENPVDQKSVGEPERLAQQLGVPELVGLGVDKQAAQDWLKARRAKRLPLTQTALDGVAQEATKAGMTLPDAIKRAATEGWAGFKASWLMQPPGKAPPNDNFADRDYGTGGRI